MSCTVYTAIGICHTGFADCLVEGSGWNSGWLVVKWGTQWHSWLSYSILILLAVSKTCMTYTHCCVYSTKTPDDGQKTCLKHVQFYSKNKFGKLVHFVGFVIRKYMLFFLNIQGGAQNVIPLIVHITHFYYYKSI